MDPRQSVRPGDPIRLAAEQVNGLNRLLANSGGFRGAGPVPADAVPYTWIYAKSASGAYLNRWQPLQIYGLLTAAGGSQFTDVPIVTVDMPQRSHLWEPGSMSWGVLVDPVPVGGIGRLAVGGVVQSQINVTNANDRFVAATNDLQLRSSSSGEGLILWKESGTGPNKWALIRLGNDRGILRVTFTAPWTKSTAIYVADAVSGQSYYAHNWFATITGSGSRNGAIAFVGDRWALIAAEC